MNSQFTSKEQKKKDRIKIFPEKILDEVKNIIAGKSGKDVVFESERGEN